MPGQTVASPASHSLPATWTPGLARRWRRRWSQPLLQLPAGADMNNDKAVTGCMHISCFHGKHSFSAHATATQNYEAAGSSRSTRASMLCWCHRLTFAKYDLPVPGGPYSRMPLQGFRLPARRGATCGTSQSAAKTGNPSEKVSKSHQIKVSAATSGLPAGATHAL